MNNEVKLHFTALVTGAVIFAHGGSAAAQDVPNLLPIQGVLTDAEGVVIDGPVPVTFSLYDGLVGGVAWYTEQQVITPEDGLFTTYLGKEGSGLDLALFAQNSEVFLGLSVGNDAEMIPRFQLGSVPFAAHALSAANASALDGSPASDFSREGHQHDFTTLTNLPADFADGVDDNTTYAAGPGLALNANNELSVDATAIEAYARNVCLDSEAEATALLDDNYAAASHTHAWSSLTGTPAGFADGVDNDTTYTFGGGLSLSVANQLSVSGVTGAMVSDGSLTGADLNTNSNLRVNEVDATRLIASQTMSLPGSAKIRTPGLITSTPLANASGAAGGTSSVIGTLTYNGGLGLLFVTATAWSTTANCYLNLEVLLNGGLAGSLVGFTNVANTHVALPGRMFYLVNGVAGQVTLAVLVGQSGCGGNTRLDTFDRVSATYVELPIGP